MVSTDTIVALATPAGRGGVAIVRVSGPLVRNITQALTGSPVKPRYASYRHFLDAQSHIIDAGIVLYFAAPASFTGEDVLELHGHGGPVVIDSLIARILELGARLANPGEFSLRAFLNGKIDLAQAEAIADLINASSQQAARSAMRSLQGEFSRAIGVLNEDIIQLRMYVEAAIDFVEEEVDFLSDEKIVLRLQSILSALENIHQQAKQGSILREGISVVIAGAPNVGKSSLLNALSGKPIAIVTNVPGTTRDVMRDHINIDGIPLTIIDTAGLRTSDDIVEQEGIKRANQEIAQADIVLSVVDASKPIDAQCHPDAKCPVLTVANKIDLIEKVPQIIEKNGRRLVYLSVKTGDGLALLKQEIKHLIGYREEEGSNFYARRRHLDALCRASDHLQNAFQQLTHLRQGELAAEDLRLAHVALGEITGAFTTEDLLGRIFSSFCIGK